MHSRLAELSAYLDRVRADLLGTVRGHEALLERREAEGRWTVAEILDHLHLVELSVAMRVREAMDNPDSTVPEMATDSVMSALDRFRISTVVKPVPTPEWLQPRENVSGAVALDALQRSRDELSVALRAADGRSLGAVRSPHPRLGDLTIYQWILFAGQHEERHRRQIEAVLGAVALKPYSDSAKLSGR